MKKSKKIILLIALMLLFVFTAKAQDYSSKKHITKVSKIYSKQLGLTKQQEKKIKKIIKKYNTQLKGVENKQLFNKLVKKQTLEIFELISKEQFSKFKKLVTTVEPFKKYKL